ncbi:MAG: FtsW/RodA/SpoVE family cell cycle protein [Ignavibacteria bacterium]|nr:FtsW/RodA/SpoVE family cell cycle protein [Ignavibacteria bacterium]MBT8381805.1 FtsW/RodA/SpoVE family cell cycle protein [Ignavibacteria bacterium]MBT8392482.1 FtsW/RodA/SpoVE family cell cycle protein [Ignavibacteria bacterium]NNJ52064.1 FtsW/RodA/SpoVE family cell cycle protein [Ignavibacteriaceae bacterium]NNL19887.1 FtsW/RodA/SpoVE family cell cycle protein [Ignavibacteriaceae bacterium]
MKKLALTIFFDSFALMLLGLIIVMSASSTYSVFKFDSVFYLFNSHLFKVGFGIVLVIAFSFIPYEIYRSLSKPAVIATLILLIITLLYAPNVKGAGRWLDLGFMSIQPAYIAMFALVIHIASLLEDKTNLVDNYRHGFLYLFIWIMLFAGLIMLQPNISSGIMIIIISLTVVYVGGGRLKHIFISMFASGILAGSVAMIFSHSRSRIISFVESIFNGGDLNFQVKQALYSLGSGGMFGVGIGNSMQSNLFLPEAYGDFIFAILGEETGLIGALLVLLSYLILFTAGILIAKNATDKFGQLLAFGITLTITLYAFVNVAVTTGIFPTTGLPLPFISYGGTFLIFVCISVGILINIAFTQHLRQKSNIDVDVNNKSDGNVE